MNRKILMAIAAVILVSGCIEVPGFPGAPTVGFGRGLEITSLTAEPTTVFSGSRVRLIMEAENQGGTTVPDEDALVYITGSNYDAWDESVTTPYKYDHFDKDMKAEDVVRGVPADTKRFAWPLTAPSLTPGQTRQDTFIGRIYHEYLTSGNGNIWVYSETEADAARTANRELYRSSFSYTVGPVGLHISVSPDPVILYGNEDEFTLYIRINNLAAGTIYYPGSVDYGEGGENVTLIPEQLNSVSISAATSGAEIGDDCTGTQELIAGRETTLVCDVTLDESPSTFQSYPLSVNVSYGYYTERTTTVTVQGK